MSVWIHSTPRASNHRPSGQPKASPLTLPLRVGALVGRVAGQHEVVPGEASAASKSPSSFQRMMWPIVLLARGLAASTPGWPAGAAVAVVGERAVDLAACRVDGDPLRPVHLGRAERVAGLARLDQHLALVGEAVGGVSGPWPCISGSQRPLPSASKRATYSVPWSSSSRLAAAPPGCDAVAADELVDVLEARVLARCRPPRGRPSSARRSRPRARRGRARCA